MKFKEAVEKIEKSDTFNKWKEAHPKCYLVHGFIMMSKEVAEEWQIGYYDPDKKTITSFTAEDKVKKNPESEVFNESGTVPALSLDKVKISLEEAMQKAESVQKEFYRSHLPLKKIFIVQNLDVGQVWNITYVTQTFNTLNIKVDSTTGHVKKHDLISIFSVS